MKYYTTNIVRDLYPVSPRRYNRFGTITSTGKITDEGAIPILEFTDNLSEIEKDYLYYPVFMFNGMLLSSKDTEWDEYHVGYIYASKDKICKRFKVEDITEDIREKVYNIFIKEIREYSQYLSGEVYKFFLYKLDKDQVEHILQGNTKYLPEDWTKKYKLMCDQDKIHFSQQYLTFEGDWGINYDSIQSCGNFYSIDSARSSSAKEVEMLILRSKSIDR